MGYPICATGGRGLPFPPRRRGNPETRPVTAGNRRDLVGPEKRETARKAQPDRTRFTGGESVRSPVERGSFGIVELLDDRRPQGLHLPGDGERGLRAAPPTASADGDPLGVGSPAQRRRTENPERVEASALAPSGFLASVASRPRSAVSLRRRCLTQQACSMPIA